MLGSACCSKNKLQQKWVNSLWQRNSQTGLQELNKWLFFSFYYQQTLVARLILREANYALKPYRLYSAPGILVPLYSIVTFCISERRSWDDNFRDTRPGCWVVWCHLWPFWNFAREKEKKKKKQDLQEDKKPLPIPENEGHSSWGTNCVSILPGQNNKVVLFYSLQTPSPYLYLALVGRKLRFWQQVLPDYQDAGPFSASEPHSNKLYTGYSFPTHT